MPQQLPMEMYVKLTYLWLLFFFKLALVGQMVRRTPRMAGRTLQNEPDDAHATLE